MKTVEHEDARDVGGKSKDDDGQNGENALDITHEKNEGQEIV